MTVKEKIFTLERRCGILGDENLIKSAKDEYSKLDEMAKQGKLPEDVYREYAYDGTPMGAFFKVKRDTFTDDELDRLVELNKLSELRTLNSNVRTVKGWVVFFGILQVIALLIGVFIGVRLGAGIL